MKTMVTASLRDGQSAFTYRLDKRYHGLFMLSLQALKC